MALPDFVFPPIIFMFSFPLVHVRCWLALGFSKVAGV